MVKIRIAAAIGKMCFGEGKGGGAEREELRLNGCLGFEPRVT